MARSRSPVPAQPEPESQRQLYPGRVHGPVPALHRHLRGRRDLSKLLQPEELLRRLAVGLRQTPPLEPPRPVDVVRPEVVAPLPSAPRRPATKVALRPTHQEPLQPRRSGAVSTPLRSRGNSANSANPEITKSSCACRSAKVAAERLLPSQAPARRPPAARATRQTRWNSYGEQLS